MGLLNRIIKRDSSGKKDNRDNMTDTVSGTSQPDPVHTENFSSDTADHTDLDRISVENDEIKVKETPIIQEEPSVPATEEMPAEEVPAVTVTEETKKEEPAVEMIPETAEDEIVRPINIDVPAAADETYTSSISSFLGDDNVPGIRSTVKVDDSDIITDEPVSEESSFDDEEDLQETDVTPEEFTVRASQSPRSEEGEKVGVIYGNVGTSSFDCNVCAHLERSEYVMVDHEDYGHVLCQVGSLIRKSNLSLEKSLKISEETVIEDVVTAHVDVIGYRDQRGLLLMPRTTFMAGSEVLRADKELVKSILGLKNNPKSGGYIGLLHGHDLPVFLDINELLQRHVCILAKTGGGKSYMSGDIIEELMKHNVTSMIIDPHGEYGAMRDIGKPGDEKFGVTPNGYADKIKEFAVSNESDDPNIRPLRFTFRTLEPREIVELMRANDMRVFLPPMKRAVEALRERQDFYSVQDLIDTLNADPENRNPLIVTEMEYINEMGVFSTRGNPITELIEKGKTTIINLKGVPPDIQQMIVKRLATVMFELRKKETVPPMMMVIEEAHNYCPQAGTVISSKPLATIASEGRKFGLGLMVISQRPAKIDKNVLSQCGTQIILKVTNPNDVKAISQSIEGLTNGMTDEIMTLPIGMALVVGAGIESPLLVEVRPRESRHGGGGVKVLED